jgi:formylmethanofuran dehydrogenase subunit B
MKEENNEIVSAAETISVDYEEILQRAVAVIENARTSVARHLATTASNALSIMYWQIGKRINTEVLDNKRAEYGKQIVASVARQLTMN